MAAFAAWLDARSDGVGLGWAVGPGRPLERQLHGIAVAAADGSSWFVPCDPDAVAAERLPAWFARDDRELIGHDVKQLITTLRADRGFDLAGPVFDTLVASYMLNPALRAQTIDDLAANRFGAELPPKPLTPETGAEERTMARRAAGEALTALLARPALEAELREASLGDLFDQVEMPLVPVLARMELAGVLIDLEALAAMRDEFGAQLTGLESRIFELVGHPFNIGSPKQLETILFDELALPATKRTRTGRSTDASVLEELKERHEAVALILEHRQVAKLKSTYVDALPTLVDARRHGCTPPTSRRSPPPAACRAPIRTSRTSRSGPRSAAASGARSWHRPGSCCSAPTTRSRSCASWPTSRATPA